MQFFIDCYERSSNMAFAVISADNELLGFQNPEVTREGINRIYNCLDTQDKISLIFLLCDDSMVDTALQCAIQLVTKVQWDVLDEWISYVFGREPKWELMLLEALSLIHNYRALRILGHSREEITDRFLPTNKYVSVYIPLKRKMLYLMIVTYQKEKMNLFLEIVQQDFQVKNLVFERYQYLEMYLLYWASIKYISTGNLKNISCALKVMGMPVEAQEFTECSKVIETTIFQEKLAIRRMNDEFDLLKSSIRSSMQENRIIENSYTIDPQLPGICLIINQEHFYHEFDQQYKHLMPKLDPKFQARTGTDVDKRRLIDTFEHLNFQMIVKDNLTHFEMYEVIVETVHSIKDQSSLIIFILTHGNEGNVYGVNSIPMKIEEIKEIMCTKNKLNLQGKPKLLILQSCQTSHHPVENNDDEGCGMDAPPNTADLLVFYASIPGFGAIRHKRKGTWFIQSFCDKIEDRENVNCHFDDICTLVQGEVTNKRCTTAPPSHTMVPMKTSTLTKFFYLPRQ